MRLLAPTGGGSGRTQRCALGSDSKSRTFGAAALLFVAVTISAGAQEYCVACTGPDVLYRCVLDGVRPGATASLPALCVTSLAKAGPHATCVIRRGVGVIDCNGPVKVVSVPPQGAPDQSAGAVTDPAPAKAAPPSGPPRTVEEMLKQAKSNNDKSMEKTKAQIESGSEQIGGFFKKSWDCVSSLFSRCDTKPK